MTSETSQLILQLDGNIIQSVPLTMPTLSIGRTPDNGVALPHPLVSRHHAELRLVPEGAMLTDLGSANGTFVDGIRLLAHQPHLLTDGGVFQIGPFLIIYRAGVASAEPAAPEDIEQQVIPNLPAPVLVEPVLPPEPIARESFPVPQAHGPHSSYLYDLPVIYHNNDFLGRFLLIFESIWEPLEHREDHIEMYFDPRTCPVSFLPWLTSWLGMAFNDHWPEPRRRQLLAEAMDLYRWRGTRYGLTRMLEICTGLTPEITEKPEQPLVFHIRMKIPPESGIDRVLVEELVRAHKPAFAGYVLELQP